MKIGFDAKRAFLNSSGLGNYSRNTLNALHRFHSENSYILFTPEITDRLFDNYQRFSVVSPRNSVAKKFKSLWRTLFLVPQLQRYGIELFHGLSNELPRGIEKSGIPAVVTIHDVIFMRYPEFFKPVDRKIYFKKVKYACHAADKIIAISQQTKQDIETFFQVPPGKIALVYQPVSEPFFIRQDGSQRHKKYNLPRQYILSVGTLEPRKNQLTLLQALHHAHIDVPVVFVGKQVASYMAKMEQFIIRNRMERQVIFLQDLPGQDLASLYQSAFFSVYISVFEGFGLPVIEAMASGCPVITSDVSVLPETAGNAALLCNPARMEEVIDSLQKLISSESLRNDLIRKGKDRAQDFHPERYARKMNELYVEILNCKNGK